MGIHVIQSQRIDVLVHGVLSTLGQPAVHPLEVLKTQHFVVPTPAIEQWLTQKMAEEQGQPAVSPAYTRFPMVCLSAGTG